MHYVILRDDDTNALTPRACLERLYRPFLANGLPVNLATIPDVRSDVRTPDRKLEGFITSGEPSPRLHVPLAENRALVNYIQSEPGYRVVHHGCHHTYFEFDDADPREIAVRLDRGAARLREAGFEKPAAFVAPYDKISRAAYSEIASRFPVISTGWFEARRLPVGWWPAFASKKLSGRPHWRIGNTALLSHPGCLLSCHRPYDKMFESVRNAVQGASLTVLVTHWWEYFRDGDPDSPFIDILHEVADWLHRAPDVKVVSFEDVANGTVPIG